MAHLSRTAPDGGSMFGRAGLIASAIVVLAAVGTMGGCYQRVTRATGFGADQYQVSEPYQESGRIDDWFWGKPPQNRTGSRLPPSPQRN